MSVTPIQSHRRYRSRFPAVPIPDSAIEVAGLLDLPWPGKPEFFVFHRTKRRGEWRCEMWLWFTGAVFGENLSCIHQTYPRNYDAARRWARAYAKRHGFLFVEKASRRG